MNNGRQIYSSPSPRLKMHLVNTGQNWSRRIQISAKHPRRKMFCMPLRILCILCSQIISPRSDSKAWCLQKTSHFRKVKAVPGWQVSSQDVYLRTCVRGEGRKWVLMGVGISRKNENILKESLGHILGIFCALLCGMKVGDLREWCWVQGISKAPTLPEVTRTPTLCRCARVRILSYALSHTRTHTHTHTGTQMWNSH